MKISEQDFCEMFRDQLDPKTTSLINSLDFSYETPGMEHLHQIYLRVLKKTESDKQIVGHESRTAIWENGWNENLRAYRSSHDDKDLVPKFIRQADVVRYKQQFILPNDSYMELNFCHVLQHWMFSKYLVPFDTVYEFGCGSGINVAAIADLFPKINIVGTDFVQPSVDIINEIAKVKGGNISGSLFDMKKPDLSFEIKRNSCVFTFGAVEQLAGEFHAFLDYLLRKCPDLCFHIEPTIEFYDPDNFVDYMAIRFHEKRGYTSGFLSELKSMDKKKIDLIASYRLNFGNQMMEGYNLIVWRPR